MGISWSRGLWRLWIVASSIWVICFAVTYGSPYAALRSNVTAAVVRPPIGMFDDLIPQYKRCWDYRTADGKNIDITKLSDDALIRTYECQLGVERSTLLRTAAVTIAAGSVLTLVLGWLLLWIGRALGAVLLVSGDARHPCASTSR
jgi:hypothetical protein